MGVSTHMSRSIMARFWATLTVALLPLLLLAIGVQTVLLRDRTRAFQSEVTLSILDKSRELRANLNDTSRIRNSLQDLVAGKRTCEDIQATLETYSADIGTIGYYGPDGQSRCSGKPLEQSVVSQIIGSQSEISSENTDIVLVQPLSDGFVVAKVGVPSAEDLGVSDYALATETWQPTLVSGTRFDPPDFPERLLTEPGQSEIYRVPDGSVLQIPDDSGTYVLMTRLDRDYAEKSLWSYILQASVVPLTLVLVAAGTSAYLINRLVIADITKLRADMQEFQRVRKVPEADLSGSIATETSRMRQKFARLAATLVQEEEIAQARLEHAEDLQREVFHRVSNNFQIVQSIARIIAREGGDPTAMKKMETQIALLSAVHHSLHHIEDSEMRSLNAALPSLVTNLEFAGLVPRSGVALSHVNFSLPVAQTYSLLHAIAEWVVDLVGQGASEIEIVLGIGQLKITSDVQITPEQNIYRRLAAAFAAEMNGTVERTENGIVMQFQV